VADAVLFTNKVRHFSRVMSQKNLAFNEKSQRSSIDEFLERRAECDSIG